VCAAAEQLPDCQDGDRAADDSSHTVLLAHGQ
jgi:hypothetical protein